MLKRRKKKRLFQRNYEDRCRNGAGKLTKEIQKRDWKLWSSQSPGNSVDAYYVEDHVWNVGYEDDYMDGDKLVIRIMPGVTYEGTLKDVD